MADAATQQFDREHAERGVDGAQKSVHKGAGCEDDLKIIPGLRLAQHHPQSRRGNRLHQR